MNVSDQNHINVNVGSGYLTLDGFVNLDNSLFLKLAKSPLYFIVRPFMSREKRKGIQLFSDALKKQDIQRYDCRKKMPFPDNSVSHILCSHFLEHLYHDECISLLKEFHRVLRPNGTAHIILPDLEAHVNEYVADQQPEAADRLMHILLAYDKPGLSLRNRVLDLSGNYGLHHLWMYDRKSMQHKMLQLGFQIENTRITPSSEFRRNDGSLHIVAFKPLIS